MEDQPKDHRDDHLVWVLGGPIGGLLEGPPRGSLWLETYVLLVTPPPTSCEQSGNLFYATPGSPHTRSGAFASGNGHTLRRFALVGF